MSRFYKLFSKIILFGFLFNFCIQDAISQDTITIQTFTWDSETRNDTFQFPNDPDLTFRKILMRYNMRCHDDQVGNGSVGCREWDYSCNTFIHDPSRVDSTRQTHPNFIISNYSGTEFEYTAEQTYSYIQYDQFQTNLIAGTGNEINIGNGDLELELVENEVSKKQFLFSAQELINEGMQTGNIYGIKLDVLNIGSEIDFLRIKLKETTATELSYQNPDLEDFTEVFFSNTQLDQGINDILFYQPFFWNDTSNVIVEISYSNNSQGNETILKAYETSLSNQLQSNTLDHYLQFEGIGTVEVPTDAFSSISEEITIAFWAKGNAEVMPRNSTIFEGRDNSNNRQINVHLPWGNGQIYWDCGNDGSGYDRINKSAAEFEYEGQWNHYAFTKNAVSGEMKIYINGSLWHEGSGLHKLIDIRNLNFGSHADGGNNYFGGIDDFQVWNKALDSATIQNWMHRSIDSNHEFYDNLIANYRMNEGSGNAIMDHSPNAINATVYLPNWKKLSGQELYKNLEQSTLRPNITFLQGDVSIDIDTSQVLDSITNGIHSIVEYAVFGEQVSPIDTFLAFPAGDMNILTEKDSIIGSIYVEPDAIVSIEDLVYHTKSIAKFEILSLVTPYGNGLDLGAEGKTFTFDVTDYAPILKGEKRMSIEMGGQWQEELDIQFLFITGTPAREVLNVQNIWPFRRGGYGEVQSDRYFEPRQLPLSEDGDAFKIRSAITGHGQNGEFVPRQHYINVLGGDQEFQYWVWKECGDNPIYPQGGTWIFDRAGWCPGAATDVHEFWLHNYADPGDAIEVDYGVNGAHMGSANYLVSNQLVTYGPFNYSLDASIERIARPNVGDVEFERINPACNTPLIIVKNGGATTITSLTFDYQVEGSDFPMSYEWTGELLPLETREVPLPLDDVRFWNTTSEEKIFEVSIRNPNGSVDENAANNFGRMPYVPAMAFDYDGDAIELTIQTNLINYDNAYSIKDAEGNVVMERDSLEASTLYEEALELPPGCYTFNFVDHANDGLQFWFFPDNGSGFLRFRRWINDFIPLNVVNFNPDFGAGVQFDFIMPEITNNKDLEQYRLVSTYPNPANNYLNVELHGFQNEDFRIELIDLTGKILLAEKIDQNSASKFIHSIDIANLQSGSYFVKIQSDEKVWTRQFVKI